MEGSGRVQKIPTMKPEYHRRITTQALVGLVSATALDAIISANLGQDALRYQLGHDHYHYDNNSFTAADAYIQAQRLATTRALSQSSASLAWQAFGRLTHTAQDFYAHTNYVTLWRERHPGSPTDEIPSLPADLLAGAPLHSGRLYYPLELLSFLPILGADIARLFPHDSHARMNKDDPSRPDFDLAYTAAVKRTVSEFQLLLHSLPSPQAALFTGQS